MNKKLNDHEKELLSKILNQYNPSLMEKVAKLESGLIDEQTIKDIREAIGSELLDKGFTLEDEPTKYGLVLENLINKLADLYLWPENNSNNNQ